MEVARCPWCDAPRVSGPRCPRCAAIYAKAEALRAAAPWAGAPIAPPPSPALPSDHSEAPAGDPGWRREYLLRLWVVPGALLLAVLMTRSPLGHALQRIFLSMLAHETGHALAAWLSGFASLPTLWVTYTAPTRGGWPVLLVVGGLGYLLVWAHRRRRPGALAVAVALLALQLWCTLLLDARAARCFITFAGDGGAMVLGTALMASFFVAPGTALHRGGLRWGLAFLGAAALVDPFGTWWQARRDADAIPFGVQEGVGLSDPSRLVETCRWTTPAMVQRYVGLGIACLALLAILWWRGVWAARQASGAGEAAGR